MLLLLLPGMAIGDVKIHKPDLIMSLDRGILVPCDGSLPSESLLMDFPD